MKKKRIFIVEADANNRALIQLAFDQVEYPHHLHTFADGPSLLENIFIGHQQPDLILLDHHPPHIDGIQILKTLKENPVLKLIPLSFGAVRRIKTLWNFIGSEKCRFSITTGNN